MRTLALEEKGDEDMFEEYNPNQMEIKINVWRPNLSDVLEETIQPSRVRVAKDQMMTDFIKMLSDQFGISQANLKVMKRNPMLQQETVDVLSTNPEKKLNQLCVNEGVNIFIEDNTVGYPMETLSTDMKLILQSEERSLSKWETEFELDHNRFTIKFNDPRKNIQELVTG